MLVLHAIWDTLSPGGFHLWTETSHPHQVSSTSNHDIKVNGAVEKPKGQKARLHPFALDHEALVETTEALANTLIVQSAHAGTLALRLPGVGRRPLPSPGLLLDEQSDNERATSLGWWQVPTLQFNADQALDLLLQLPNEAPAGVVFGSDLRFWIEAALFSYELLSKQSYVPSLQESRHRRVISYRAAWEAALDAADNGRLQTLARMMPPICWSFTPPGLKSASLPYECVRQFINQAIDGYVRERLTSLQLVPAHRGRRPAAQLMPERWLQALSSEESALEASPEELKQFASTLHPWLEQVRPAATDAPFRTCFRLDPPVEEEGKSLPWRVSFYLQAHDDPSLLVPAEQVWRERSSVLTFLKRKFENPQERLLADLGRATRLFPLLEESLKHARPQDLALTTEQAYAFLRQSAPLLEQSGFGVLVPPWWSKGSARLRVKLKMRSPQSSSASGLLGLNGIVSYDWSLAIGDVTLTAEEFQKLVKLKMPLIQVRGQWVELQPEQIEAAIAFFKKKHGQGSMTMGEALRLGLGEGLSATGLEVAGIEAEGGMKDLLDRLTEQAKITSLEPPTAFQGRLRPYQLKGVSWLAFLQQYGFGSCLADSMGLGKTAQLICLLLYERQRALQERRPAPGPTLVVCPMSIVGNWHKELTRFAPSLRVAIHYGPDRLAGEALLEHIGAHDVVITTYGLTLRDQEHLATIDWENIVLDEAQNIKNENAKQTQAVKKLPAKHRIALTGTPVENRLSELWSIMEFLNPGYLGSGTDFRKSFATPIERYHDVERSTTLKRLVQPFILRRLKTDKSIIQDLPEKQEMKVYCNLTQEQASLYEAVVKEMMEKIENAEGIERRGLILATLLRLKQVCNHPAHFIGDGSSLTRRSGKLTRLEEMLEEVLSEGDKTLIFTQFAEMGTMLRHYIQESFGCETLFLHGGVVKKQRDLMVQRFQEERQGPPVFILSLKAGGVGLNLTAANHVFHFDRWWNPAVEDQATDRAFRIGQMKNVQVHKFVCVGTVEERIDQMIEQKKALAENIVGSGEDWLTEMSTGQLHELFALSREAVST